MKITALIDNDRAPDRPDLRPEWGLSLFIEHLGRRILFDSGASAAFASNAAILGIDLSAVDLAVLSHHHADHAGGFAHFLTVNSTALLHLSRHLARDRSMQVFGIRLCSVGMDLGLVAGHLDRVSLIDGSSSLANGVHLLDDAGNRHPRPKGNRLLYATGTGPVARDTFNHELVMVLQEEGGVVAFTGCSHRGIANMVAMVCARFPGVPVLAVFGGFHLAGAPLLSRLAVDRGEAERMGQTLLQFPVVRYYTGHCTGQKGFRVLKEILGDRLVPFPTGASVEI